uniref:Methyltransferase domain-containing protein n=1 Tax=Amphora coffeiformis TaxID=265554 RepID=A0A7S3L7I1_9STRA|eukprot:scaffold370_cov176-Amphora_coffeaeformis.AAC.13
MSPSLKHAALFLIGVLSVVAFVASTRALGDLSSVLKPDCVHPETSSNSILIAAANNSYDSTHGEEYFLKTAQSLLPVTDKVTTHTYQIMYGQYLLPFYKEKPHMKMLEIGLGCDMGYGPGASVAVWKKLFPEAELWEAEFDGKCVEKAKANGMLEGLHVLVGDQGNPAVLDQWIEQSGGADFDVVIDDGGHQNCQIWTSFLKLWPHLKPNGLYFIEDMQVAKWKNYRNYQSTLCDKSTTVPEKLKIKIDEMLYNNKTTDVKFMFCQREACVLGKK